jgi:type I restriction enzyme, S subunit
MTANPAARNWTKGRLQDLVFFQRGFDITQAEQSDGPVPVISSSGITSHHNEARAAGPGVVIGRKGTLGSVHYSEADYWPHDTTLWSKDLRGNNPRFVYFYLRTFDFRRFDVGNSNPTLNRNHIHNVPALIPPLDAQDRIANILTAYDDLIDNNRRRMVLLEEAARHLFSEWFVRLRFPGYGHTRIQDGVPERWEWRQLETVCSRGDGIQTGPFGSQLHQSDYSDDGVPVVMPKDIIGCRVVADTAARIPDDVADKLRRHRMMEGDTVYGRRGEIGRRAFIGPWQAGWLCGTGCLRIRPEPTEINPRFLFDALGSPESAGTIVNRAKGSTMPNLSAGSLCSVPILVADRCLQDRYAEDVRPLNELFETLEQQNQKLRAARDLLLPRLMSGEIAV